MIIKNKNNNLFIKPNFDSGTYIGTFTIEHDKLNNLDLEDPKWDICSLLIATYVGSYLDGKFEGFKKEEHGEDNTTTTFR